MDNAKKVTERKQLIKFLSSLELSVSSIKEFEPPDFSFSLHDNGGDKKGISVELTRVFNPNLKKVESAQDRIMELAKTMFREVRNDSLEVYVDFSSEPFNLDNNSLNALARELSASVLDIANRNEGFGFRLESKSYPPFHKHFKTLSVTNYYDFENWQSFGAFLVPHIEADWFNQIIKSKEKNINRYPQQYDENWLVIVSNFGHESSAFEFGSLSLSYKDSAFDRIYIFKYFENEAIKIK